LGVRTGSRESPSDDPVVGLEKRRNTVRGKGLTSKTNRWETLRLGKDNWVQDGELKRRRRGAGRESCKEVKLMEKILNGGNIRKV